MTLLGKLLIGLGKTVEKVWYKLKCYSSKCRIVYANVLET